MFFFEQTEDFKFILDSWDIDVLKVEEISQPKELETASENDHLSDESYQTYLTCSTCEGLRLEFETDRRCVKIWKKGLKTAAEFPSIVKITYRTHPKGHSLKWTKDQDGRYKYVILQIIESRKSVLEVKKICR